MKTVGTHRIVDAETDEPAEQQVVLHLLDQPPLGAHRKQDPDQAGPHEPLRRDRRPTLGRVEPVELRVEAGQRIVDDPLDLPQRMTRRDAILDVDIAEQRPADLVRPAHRLSPRRHSKEESRSSTRVEAPVFQQPVKEATVRRYHYETHDGLRAHLSTFLEAYNFADA